jgi:hypothetical protein
MEGARKLAGRQDCGVIAKLLGADAITDLTARGGEGAALLYAVERNVVEVQDGL